MAQITTRCFGYGLPYTALIPGADNYNHNHVAVEQEIINTTKHLEADESTKYFTKEKN